MNDDRGVLRGVSWRDLCSWLLIFRAYGQAVRLPALALATLAVLLTPVGWRLSEQLFLEENRAAAETLDRYAGDAGQVHRWPDDQASAPIADDFRRSDSARGVLGRAMGQIASVFHG